MTYGASGSEYRSESGIGSLLAGFDQQEQYLRPKLQAVSGTKKVIFQIFDEKRTLYDL
jgi:hypothetical protein